MGLKKEVEQHIRKITRVGNGDSVSLTLPITMARKLKLRKGQKVVVKLEGKRIIIEDWKK